MSNSLEYKCPTCQHIVPMDDINQERNIALCRNCGASFAFSDLINEEQDDHILATPPKRLIVEKTTQGMTMTYQKRGVLAFFILIFALFWTGMVWGIMVPTFAGENASEFLFCIPFILMDILILCFAIFLLFGKSIISASRGKGTYFCGIGILSISRNFDLTSQTKFGEKIIGHSNGFPIWAMTISNPAKKQIVLGHLISEDAFPYIKSVLNQLRN